jgi:2-iminobutanoate/2-iminopropanoate deaminase
LICCAQTNKIEGNNNHKRLQQKSAIDIMDLHKGYYFRTNKFMSKQIINTPNAPAPIGPYNQSVKSGALLFVSGQVALHPVSGDMVQQTIEDETHQVMKNLQAILTEAGLGLEQVVKTTIFLSDMALFARVNDVYASYFTSNYPARETVAVKGLPKNANVEISVVAAG